MERIRLKNKRFFWIILGFCILAPAQPDWSILFCLLSATVGYAFFWKGLLDFDSKKIQFYIATIWFSAITGIHISWLTSDRYTGSGILVFYLILCFGVGLQFGITSLLISKQMSLLKILTVAGVWAIMEWSRLFFLSGYTWNPAGLALTGTSSGMQFVSLAGVYGLSFWVILTNLFALSWMQFTRGWRQLIFFSLIALMPYMYGGLHLAILHKAQKKHKDKPFSVLLVQTAMQPEKKIPIQADVKPLSPDLQWNEILSLLHEHVGKDLDLIVFSEAVVPYGTDFPIYPRELITTQFKNYFGSQAKVPTFTRPLVGNSGWVHALTDTFKADVVIGLEDIEQEKAFNSAFFFRPFSPQRERYDKRILLPIAEYFPFQWLKGIAARHGIQDCFTCGREAKVFSGKRCPIGVSICYEESFGHLMLENKKLGAELFVNLTNDVWYPMSRLPIVHYLHGRLRSVEMGVPMVRACNTGITCGIDSLGNTVASLDFESRDHASPAGALYVSVSSFTYSTLYSIWGDWLIVVFSLSCIGLTAFTSAWRERVLLPG